MARTAHSYQHVMMLQIIDRLRRMGYSDSQIKLALMGKAPTKRRVPLPRNNRNAAYALVAMKSNRSSPTSRSNNKRRPKRTARRPSRYW